MGSSTDRLTNAILGKDEREEKAPEKKNVQITPIAPALKNTSQPSYEVQNEQAWHRSLAYMLLQGETCRTCAKYFGKTSQHITQVRKQPWFKDLLAELSELHFDNNVAKLLQSCAVEAVTSLTDLAIGAESEAVRRSAASDLLKMHLQNVPARKNDSEEDPEKEVQRLDAELERLEQNTPEQKNLSE